MTPYKPNVSEDLAKHLVKELYGLEVLSIKRMVSYADQNFHISVSDNHENPYISHILKDGYTLKIINTKKSCISGYFELMHTMMAHLNKKCLRTPMPLRDLNGNTWCLQRVPLLNEGQEMNIPMLCGVQILSFISGSTISTVGCTKNALYQWGALLAKYHIATEDFICSTEMDNLEFWRMEYALELLNQLEDLSEDRKILVLSVLNKYQTEVEANYHLLSKGTIHGDFNEGNVLVQEYISQDGDKIFSVDGILDFEDTHEGTYMWDVAVMMAYALLQYNAEDVLEGPGHALAGYLSIRPLNNVEINMLKVGMELRMCQSLVLCARAFLKDSSNLYLLRSVKTGWPKLIKSVNTTNEELLQKWGNIQIFYE